MILAQAPPPPAAVATAPPELHCDSTSELAFTSALDAVKAKDTGSAKGLVDPELLRCPASEPLGRALRVFRADLALADREWPLALSTLQGVSRPGGVLGVEASFAALRADSGLKDAAAFGTERDALIAAVDTGLAAAGQRVGRFDAGGASVTGYESPVVQGAFARRVEFVIRDPGAFSYPRTVMLTDDLQADKLTAALAAKGTEAAPATKTWFVDLYTCALHVTLKQLHAPLATPPAYAEVKAVVTDYLSKPAPEDVAAPAGMSGTCPSATWLAPAVAR